MHIRDLIPPIALDFIRRRRNHQYGFSGSFASFTEAQNVAEGYQTTAIARSAAVVEDAQEGVLIDSRTQQLAAALAAIPRRPLTVLDFGGASGGYFRRLERFIPLDWTVFETPTMVQANRHRSGERLAFISSLAQARPTYDVALMSGVLQYLPEPRTALRAWPSVRRTC